MLSAITATPPSGWNRCGGLNVSSLTVCCTPFTPFVRRVVDAADRAAEHRRVLDRRVHHAVAEDVETELRLAGDDVLLVVGGGVLADEAPGASRLELQHLALRHAQLRRRRHQRAVAEPAAARRVHHFVVLRRALGLGHVPLRRRRAHQHRPRRGAGVAERFVEVADRSRAVGVLVAVARIADALLDGDPAPVRLELVGRHLRQRRPDAGAHLGSVRDDEDRAVGPDAEIDARVEGARTPPACGTAPPAPTRIGE